MNNAEIVLSFIQALNTENFVAAREYLNDNMRFVGVLGTREGAGIYIADMEKMKLKYDIKKYFPMTRMCASGTIYKWAA